MLMKRQKPRASEILTLNELVGKLVSNPPKVITVVADNFSLLQDQARFLRALLAIPQVKELPFVSQNKRLIQIGPIQNEVAEQVLKFNWVMNHYENCFDKNICDRIDEDVSDVQEKSLIFINDVSKLQLSSFSKEGQDNFTETNKLLLLIEKLRKKHFLILIYQNSFPKCHSSNLLRNLEFLSDAFAKVKSFKSIYMKTIWWQTVPVKNHSLIPSKVETHHYTCKVGKFYWSSDLLCFYERKEVPKDYDPETDTALNTTSSSVDSKGDHNEQGDIKKKLLRARLEDDDSDEDKRRDDDDEDSDNERGITLPYTQAKNPDQSRIFYYPDKDDDIDEDDPDNDLNF